MPARRDYFYAILLGLTAIPTLLILRHLSFLPGQIAFSLVDYFGPFGLLILWIAIIALLAVPAILSGLIVWFATHSKRLAWVSFSSAVIFEFLYILILPK